MAPVLSAVGLILSTLEAIASIHAGFNSSVIDKVRQNVIASSLQRCVFIACFKLEESDHNTIVGSLEQRLKL